ncbi:uncharacterized protein LOC126902854 [Daktulosphaira vitifoliae]|uniref:uncharacterized protein LOC126902854 n=1 Tax=Daktulosphaira vitifoliae TaxID=58002 RepID=UPI0021AA7010|nr:uncharacterized protein LOC126902854 [Daktulosphaira vitifoliae]
MLTLQKQDYYTSKSTSRCPMPYNENTILDDPDLVRSKYFNPRKCKKPWTWTQKNEIDVPVPIDDTIGKKLGNIIKPCIKNNTNIIQCYTHYLNVMESVGLTLIDRFCLFELELWNKLGHLELTVDYKEDFSLFTITINFKAIKLIFDNSKKLLKNIIFAFKRYYISTLPLDCVENILEIMQSFSGNVNEIYQFIKLFKQCRILMKKKRNYAVLDNDQYWNWDFTSVCKPDDHLLVSTQNENGIIGLNLFTSKQIINSKT